MVRKVFVLISLALILSLAGSVSAALYEGFDYDPGDLNGRNGGTGWDSAWYECYDAGSGSPQIVAPGLTYDGLSVEGNSLLCDGKSASYRNMPAGFDPLGNTIWISFIEQGGVGANAKYGNVVVADGDEVHPQAGDLGETFTMGAPSQTNAPRYYGLVLRNKMGDPGVVTGRYYSDVEVTDESVFLVYRIINGDASAHVTAWVNPDISSGEPLDSEAYCDESNAGRITFDRLRFDCAEASVEAEKFNYDELRIGSSWAEVVPEPATVVLLGLGGLLSLRRRRA